jgi:hypothetical protein
MTYEEAVRIRARQLQGEAIAPALIEEALRLIKVGNPTPRHSNRSLPLRMIAMLKKGPMERADFYAAAHQLYERAGRSQGPNQRITQMVDEGWMVDEVRLTAKGLQKLGASQ